MLCSRAPARVPARYGEMFRLSVGPIMCHSALRVPTEICVHINNFGAGMVPHNFRTFGT